MQQDNYPIAINRSVRKQMMNWIYTVKKKRLMESHIKQYKLLNHGVYLECHMPSLHFGFNLVFSTYTTTNTQCPFPKKEGTGWDEVGIWFPQRFMRWALPLNFCFLSVPWNEKWPASCPTHVVQKCSANLLQHVCAVLVCYSCEFIKYFLQSLAGVR